MISTQWRLSILIAFFTPGLAFAQSQTSTAFENLKVDAQRIENEYLSEKSKLSSEISDAESAIEKAKKVIVENSQAIRSVLDKKNEEFRSLKIHLDAEDTFEDLVQTNKNQIGTCQVTTGEDGYYIFTTSKGKFRFKPASSKDNTTQVQPKKFSGKLMLNMIQTYPNEPEKERLNILFDEEFNIEKAIFIGQKIEDESNWVFWKRSSFKPETVTCKIQTLAD